MRCSLLGGDVCSGAGKRSLQQFVAHGVLTASKSFSMPFAGGVGKQRCEAARFARCAPSPGAALCCWKRLCVGRGVGASPVRVSPAAHPARCSAPRRGGERTSKSIGCVGRVHGKTLYILKFGSLNSELFAKGELQALLSLRSKCCCSPAAVFEDKPQFGREPLLPLWLFVSQTGLVSYQSYKLLRLMTDPAARAVLCPAKLLVGWVWRWEDRAMGKVS